MAVLFFPPWRRIPNSRGLRFLGGEIQWVETARYLGVTLDRGLTWKPHIDQVRRKESQRLCILSPLLNQRSSLSIGNGVLLYKQLIRPMMDYAQSRVFLVIIFLLFLDKISEFRINCFKFTQYFTKISRLILLLSLLLLFVSRL